MSLVNNENASLCDVESIFDCPTTNTINEKEREKEAEREIERFLAFAACFVIHTR